MLWMIPLAGAAAGALLNKKDPLKGALIGGALGAGGMAAAPMLGLGAAGAAGASGAASAAGAAGASGAAGAAGASGAAGAAQAAAAPAAEAGLFSQLAQYTKPAAEGLQAVGMAQQMMGGGQEQPVQHAQMNRQPVDFSSL